MRIIKNTLLLGLLVFILGSCGSGKVVRASQKVLKGHWSLDQITYSEQGTFNVNLFHDASATCFETSTWRFIPNNNTGYYSIEGASCTSTGDQHFVFHIQEVDAETGLYDFMLKPTNRKGKSESNAGYRIRLQHLTDDTMQWKQTISLDGKPFEIYMNFNKITD